MTHYIDIRARSLPEISEAHIIEKLFGKVHLALVESRRRDVGICFPEADETRPALGACLRLHGPESSLRLLVEARALAAMRDYLRFGQILSAPATNLFWRVRRVQPKGGVDRRRRRYAKRHNLAEEEAARLIPESKAEESHLPYIRVRSGSSGFFFKLFIKHDLVLETSTPGEFNAYGLSDTATIPNF